MTLHIEKYVGNHPKPDVTLKYGTAGLRSKLAVLDYATYIVGIVAALRSKQLNGQVIGCMVTASHNPPEDNGVKVVDPMGTMLVSQWEDIATTLANTEPAQLQAAVEKVITDQKIDMKKEGHVLIAMDTRELSPQLVQSCIEGFELVGNTTYKDYGLLTTPQLHYLVRTANDKTYGECSETGYYDKMVHAFEQIYQLGDQQPVSITIDCANGVGAPAMEKFKRVLNRIDITLVNTNIEDPLKLNVLCGADYVKTNQKLPAGVSPKPNVLYASFDGDADRLICYFTDDHGGFHLLDGDKMSTLIALVMQQLFNDLPLLADQLKIGVVQTAYANGSSTNYIQNTLKLPVECTPTGVKHLHHAAENFDIGIYFEANGHGTVCFSKKAQDAIDAYKPEGEVDGRAATILKALSNLINQTVGDAISDLLTILAILYYLRLSPQQWDEAYTDLPNKLIKVIVPDRTIFKTTDAERKLVEPAGLQSKIDELVAKYPQGRSFVRASGTEDAVRVYAEAAKPEHAQELVALVGQLVE
ncbi:hypothetical protein JNB11_03135 [Kocuria palustris]|nr:hypothetical protein [Kocuria palustris]